jgi:hypothetical protein
LAGQVEKSVTHNEALAKLDVAVCAAIDGYLLNTPPASPGIGSSYIIGADPTAAWAGHPFALAGFTEGGWRFVDPVAGLQALERASGEMAVFRDGAWEKGKVRAQQLSVGGVQVVGPRLAAVAEPAGGASIDAEARGAIAAILARLRTHGLIDA